MVTFTAFSNLLPDPAHPITDAGDIASSGTPGPGFSALAFRSNTETQVSRTQGGRGITRDGGVQYWSFNISYNPMFRFQFDPIDTFLVMRNPRRDPFYVILPQYSKPKDATYNGLNTTVVKENTLAGNSALIVKNTAGSFVGSLKPGDMFTIADPQNYNHQKVYKIGAVETNDYFQAGSYQPALNELRIHIAPPLQRDVFANAPLVLKEPKFRVISQSDVQEHELNTDNLYSFSLSVEEIQP